MRPNGASGLGCPWPCIMLVRRQSPISNGDCKQFQFCCALVCWGLVRDWEEAEEGAGHSNKPSRVGEGVRE